MPDSANEAVLVPAYVNLYVEGLAVVRKSPDGKIPHCASTIVPPTESEGSRYFVPPHHSYLGIIEGDVAKTEGRLPPKPYIQLAHSTTTPADMRFMKLEHGTKVTLSPPDSEWRGGPAKYEPATIGDLGLGDLHKDICLGMWQPAEDARLHLPAKSARAEWGRFLGKFDFGQGGREVADLFYWRGFYKDLCMVTVDRPTDRGVLYLKGKTRMVFISVDPDEKKPDIPEYEPFAHSHVFAEVASGKRSDWQRPDDLSEHGGSGSCPPVGWP